MCVSHMPEMPLAGRQHIYGSVLDVIDTYQREFTKQEAHNQDIIITLIVTAHATDVNSSLCTPKQLSSSTCNFEEFKLNIQEYSGCLSLWAA